MEEHWLLKKQGAKRLQKISSRFRQSTISHAERSFGREFKSYSPWMCNTSSDKSIERIFGGSEFFINNDSALEEIRRFFQFPNSDKYAQKNATQIGSFNKVDRRTLEQAIFYLRDGCKPMAAVFDSLVDHIVPVRTLKGVVQKIGVGNSSHKAKGAIFIGIPDLGINSPVQLAINLAHELGHQALMLYQASDPIIKGDIDRLVYSGVRRCNRPAIQAFHALVALSFMSYFLSELDLSKLSCDERRLYVLDQKEVVFGDFKESLKHFQEGDFTLLGAKLFNELEDFAYVG